MLERAFSRDAMLNNLGLFTLVAALSAVSVHPQTVSPADATAGTALQSGNQGASQSNELNLKGSTAQTPVAHSTVNAIDRRMMADLAHANFSEIEAGKLAQSKASSDQVRSFAQKMVDDHTKAQNSLQQLADAKGIELPTRPDGSQQRRIRKLSSLSGDAFDKAYMSQDGLKDHQKAHKLVARISTRANDPDLKALGKQLQPGIDQHLQMAEQINKSGVSAGETSSGK
jgi:putative membrane protein